jgi:hypothetical protein
MSFASPVSRTPRQRSGSHEISSQPSLLPRGRQRCRRCVRLRRRERRRSHTELDRLRSAQHRCLARITRQRWRWERLLHAPNNESLDGSLQPPGLPGCVRGRPSRKAARLSRRAQCPVSGESDSDRSWKLGTLPTPAERSWLLPASQLRAYDSGGAPGLSPKRHEVECGPGAFRCLLSHWAGVSPLDCGDAVDHDIEKKEHHVWQHLNRASDNADAGTPNALSGRRCGARVDGVHDDLGDFLGVGDHDDV